MPYLIVQSKWPSESTADLVKKAVEVSMKYPPDESLGEDVVPNAVHASHKGYRTIGITLVKEGKLEALWDRTVKAMAMYGPIHGLEYKIEVWATLEEAYAAIGQTPPG
ncbi:MAG: hypothetical protein ACFE8N_10625 [Promethearchaeota archaeon]